MSHTFILFDAILFDCVCVRKINTHAVLRAIVAHIFMDLRTCPLANESHSLCTTPTSLSSFSPSPSHTHHCVCVYLFVEVTMLPWLIWSHRAIAWHSLPGRKYENSGNTNSNVIREKIMQHSNDDLQAVAHKYVQCSWKTMIKYLRIVFVTY